VGEGLNSPRQSQARAAAAVSHAACFIPGANRQGCPAWQTRRAESEPCMFAAVGHPDITNADTLQLGTGSSKAGVTHGSPHTDCRRRSHRSQSPIRRRAGLKQQDSSPLGPMGPRVFRGCPIPTSRIRQVEQRAKSDGTEFGTLGPTGLRITRTGPINQTDGTEFGTLGLME
jgi:hypothetical protein